MKKRKVTGSEATRDGPDGSLEPCIVPKVWGPIPDWEGGEPRPKGPDFWEGEAGHHVLLEGKMGDTSRSPTLATKLQRIAEQAIQYPTMVFTTLLYLIDIDFLREAYQRTRKDCAPGIDGVTAEEYAEHLEENLRDLHERIQSGRYMAPPVKRTWALQGGWKSAADRHADVRGQDRPTGGGVAFGGYL